MSDFEARLPDDGRQRPGALTRTALVMCAFNVAQFFTLDPALESFAGLLGITAILATISFIVIWFYWRGQNWARWLVLVTSVVALLMLGLIPGMKRADIGLTLAEGVFALWLLYWLNTSPVALYFRNTPARPAFGRAMRWLFGGLGAAVVLVAAAVVALVYISPTERPVYAEQISAAHREALRPLYPESEQLLGLYSQGAFSVTEIGCLFTDNRVAVFEDGRVRRQATYLEIEAIRLRRNTGFWGQSELTIEKKDGMQLFCVLPNVGYYANDPSEFHERVTRAWHSRARPLPE